MILKLHTIHLPYKDVHGRESYILPYNSKVLGCVTDKDHFVLLVAHEGVQQPTGPSTLGELKP
jgi:hypothetical protein